VVTDGVSGLIIFQNISDLLLQPLPILSAAFLSALMAAAEAEQQAFRSDNMSNPLTPMQSPGVSSKSKSLYSSTDPGTNHALGMLATKWMDSKHVAQHVWETGVSLAWSHSFI